MLFFNIRKGTVIHYKDMQRGVPIPQLEPPQSAQFAVNAPSSRGDAIRPKAGMISKCNEDIVAFYFENGHIVFKPSNLAAPEAVIPKNKTSFPISM